jgi:hypothetical protein
MPGDATYTLTTTGGVADPSQSAVGGNANAFFGDIAATSTGVACSGGSACKAGVRGMIGSGANGAARAVFAFVLSSGGATGKALRGAVVLTAP